MAQHSITVTGNIITDPRFAFIGEHPHFKMRIAASRAFRQGDEWVNRDSLYLSVECWGPLAENCRVSLYRGLPVLVTGTLVTHEWVDEKENKQSRIVLRASHVGVDLKVHKTALMTVTTETPPSITTPENQPQETDTPVDTDDLSVSLTEEDLKREEVENEEKELVGAGVGAGATESEGEGEVPF